MVERQLLHILPFQKTGLLSGATHGQMDWPNRQKAMLLMLDAKSSP